jgi:hypothetical protein
MGRKQYGLVVLLALVAGFIGGVFSSQIFASRPLFTEKEPRQQKVVVAEKFRLVDETGMVRAALGLTRKGQPGLGMLDKRGLPRIVLGIGKNGQPSLVMWDQKANPIWSAPQE